VAVVAAYRGAFRPAQAEVTESGGGVDETVKLLPGRYVLYCGVADHRARGKQAVLLVRR
jgi:hypothetical protein